MLARRAHTAKDADGHSHSHSHSHSHGRVSSSSSSSSSSQLGHHSPRATYQASYGPGVSMRVKTMRTRSLSSTWEKTDGSELSDNDQGDDEDDEENEVDNQHHRMQEARLIQESSRQLARVAPTPTPAMPPAPTHAVAAAKRLRIVHPCSVKSAATAVVGAAACAMAWRGWTRGQPAEVRWEVQSKAVRRLRIDVCNVAWDVPTTIAHSVAADAGVFRWKRVYWGMPIKDGYYLNIYDASGVAPDAHKAAAHSGDKENNWPGTTMPLLAQSELFAVVK